MSQQPFLYRWAGLTVASPLELPELEVATGSPTAAQIHVHLHTTRGSRVPAALPSDFRRFRAASGGRIIFCPPLVGRFVIHRSGLIEVAPHGEATLESIRACLIGPALAAAAYQRRWLVLHACAVAVGEEAVMFVGPSGVGKSTLAAYLSSQGYALFGDDVGIVVANDSGVRLMPSHHSLKLDGASVRSLMHMGLDLGEAQISARRRGKAALRLNVPKCGRALLVRRVYAITREPSITSPAVRPIGGVAALATIAGNCYRPQIVGLLGDGQQHLQRCTALHRQARVFELRVPHGHHRLGELVVALTNHWASPKRPPDYEMKESVWQP